MKNYFTYSVLLLFTCFVLQSCETSDDDGPIEEKESLNISPLPDLEFIPYEVFEIPVDNPPGAVTDYQLRFGNTAIIISRILSDAIEIIVPKDIPVGMAEAILSYKGTDYDLGNVEVLDHNNYFPANLAYAFSENEEFPLILIDSAQTVIVPKVTDGIIENVSFHFKDGTFSFLELNEDGLPRQLYNEQLKVIYDNYDLENNTVNIAYFTADNTDNAGFEYAVPLDPEMLGLLGKSRSMNKQSGVTEMFTSSLAASISLASCAAGIATAPTGVGLFLVAISCGSATYSAMKIINPNFSNQSVNKAQAFTNFQMDALGCLSLPLTGTPANALELYGAAESCTNFFMEAYIAAEDAYNYYTADRELVLERFRTMLNSGYGDIKITLTWDREVDIDLWVTDPNSERIWYQTPTSSSGGELDVDNVEGYGPENVYWPVNESPFGTYMVQIHYYGPADGPVTNCQVVIDNFGVQTTYNQALTPDGLATIAVFEAGLPAQSAPQNATAKVKSSSLPPKK